ncbi:MAG TPA: NAD(P)H-hydrate dehydratase [Acidimicrobiales bacterium]|nr:NAD(P)H-hydrate dehydratase [Acidimicrobiales bacterium]
MQRVDDHLLREWPLPQPDDADSKEERGRILILGGSASVPGAVRLAGEAALRVGAGKLQLATASSVAGGLALLVPEALVVALEEDGDGDICGGAGRVVAEQAQRAQAVVIGVGMSAPDPVREIITALVAVPGPVLVLDAAAITCLEGCGADLLGPARERVVLTPNAAEAATLARCEVDDVNADPLQTAQRLVDELGVVVSLKGATTYTCAPDGRVFADEAGNVGLGTSGSGDVVAGAIGGLAARGADPLQAAVFGIHVHAAAGDRLAERVGPLGYLARELAPEFPSILAELARLAGTKGALA